jgi:DnaJ-class molecular chaperone
MTEWQSGNAAASNPDDEGSTPSSVTKQDACMACKGTGMIGAPQIPDTPPVIGCCVCHVCNGTGKDYSLEIDLENLKAVAFIRGLLGNN